MKGHKFLKITGILMIVSVAISILAMKPLKKEACGRVRRRAWRVGGRTRRSIRPDLLLLGGAVSDAGRRHLPADRRCQRRQALSAHRRSRKVHHLIWGAIVAVFCILSTVLSMVNGGEFNFMSILTGVAVPALYIYGAVLNSKTEDEFAA